MMPLVNQAFAATFTMARGRAAPHRDATGAVVMAGVDEPRFDHDIDGAPSGLLVEGRPEFSQADRLRVISGDWATAPGTVLHAFETVTGEMVRRAWYASADPVAVVNGCLGLKGRHRTIAYVPGYLMNRDGSVLWRRSSWTLGALLGVEPGVALGATNTLPLLEG